MKTYILKYTINNYIDFPIGTIVKIVSPQFISPVYGYLRGRVCHCADGLEELLVENNKANRANIRKFIYEEKRIQKQLENLRKNYKKMPTVKF